MKRITVLAAALSLLPAACSDVAENPLAPSDAAARASDEQASFLFGRTAYVTTGDDAGPGSLRAALEEANDDGRVRTIRVRRGVRTIRVASTLAYTGRQSLTIDGSGASIDGADAPAGTDAFVANGGGDLTLYDLTVRNADGNGVLVEVPGSQRGVVTVSLIDVELRDNGLSGLYVDDQAGGSNPGGADSDASLLVLITSSVVEGNGFRPDVFDFDGVRVDEGGQGSLFNVIVGSTFTGNAGDGVELDETGNGDADAYVRGSRFDDNGTQPQNTDDLEDGFDIDENDAGNLVARLVDVVANGNRDEGIDLDEEGTGDIGAWFTDVVARGNLDSNVTFTEDEISEAGGTIAFIFRNVRADDSEDDDGFKPEEFGPGNLEGLIISSSFSRNADDGIQAEQSGAGTGTLRLLNVTTTDNDDDAINADGVTVIRN